MQYPASLQDSSSWCGGVAGSHRHLPRDARLAPSPVMYHLCGTRRPQLYPAPTMGIGSPGVEMGSARHTQQPGSNRSYLLSQQASETGITAISPSSPGRRTDRLWEREKDIKVEVNALKINVAKVYQEMPVLHSKSHKLSKWNYPLQWLDYCFKRPLWNYLNFYQNNLKKTHALLNLL